MVHWVRSTASLLVILIWGGVVIAQPGFVQNLDLFPRSDPTTDASLVNLSISTATGTAKIAHSGLTSSITVGGRRVSLVEKTGNDAGSLVSLRNVTDQMAYSSESGQSGQFWLYYGYVDVSVADRTDFLNANHSFSDLNLNISTGTSTHMRFEVIDSDAAAQAGSVTITAISGHGTSNQMASVSKSITAPGTFMTFSFAEFLTSNANLNIHDLDQIVLASSSLGLNADFTIDDYTLSVPEPATYALIGLGGLGLIGYRRFRRRRDRLTPEARAAIAENAVLSVVSI